MFSLKVNGRTYNIDASTETPLMWVLRDQLGFTGVKYGCGIGECGSCTVLIDGEATRSCTTTADSVQGSEILTIEGMPEVRLKIKRQPNRKETVVSRKATVVGESD